jgi:hypothetical protein
MLTVYFDDSGTHSRSDVVLWAGLCGTQDQWSALSQAWAAKLMAPCPGKEPLSWFHATDCMARKEEFLGWTRDEAEYAASEFTQVIVDSGVDAYASAVQRKDWDELVTGDLRILSGDAEGHCIRNCYAGAMRWAGRQSDPQIAFVFDNRVHRRIENETQFQIRKAVADHYQSSPSLVSVTFAMPRQFYPLQAADLLAWEYYQFANEILRGESVAGEPKRKNMRRMIQTGRLHLKFRKRKDIEVSVEEAKRNAEQISYLAKGLLGLMDET